MNWTRLRPERPGRYLYRDASMKLNYCEISQGTDALYFTAFGILGAAKLDSVSITVTWLGPFSDQDFLNRELKMDVEIGRRSVQVCVSGVELIKNPSAVVEENLRNALNVLFEELIEQRGIELEASKKKVALLETFMNLHGFGERYKAWESFAVGK